MGHGRGGSGDSAHVALATRLCCLSQFMIMTMIIMSNMGFLIA